MNIGRNILELRRKKNVTQDEMAAELGVTAAAVSKWENGYTLPDILMLCALADYFEVTTDELLGRYPTSGKAVVAASTPELAQKIKELAARNGITTKQIFDDIQDAVAAVRCNPEITHLLIGIHGNGLPETEFDLGERAISFFLSVSNSDQGILNDLQSHLRD